MKRVALLFGGWIKAPNGASSVVKTLCDSCDVFKENGIDMHIYTMELINDKFEGVSFHKDSKNLLEKLKHCFHFFARRIPLFAWIEIYYMYMRHAKAIVRLYKAADNKDDIVFMHDIYTAYYFLKGEKTSGRRAVLMLHTNGDTFSMDRIYYPCICNSWVMNKLLKMEKEVVDSGCSIGFVAKAPAEHFVQTHPNILNDIFYIYNGISNYSIQSNANPEPKYRMVCTGTLSDRKGQLRLVEALNALPSSKKTDFHLTLVGGGEYYDVIQLYLRKNDLEQYVSLVGSQKDVDKYLAQSNVFILASKDEGLPISIMEAMRAQLPIISTRIAGIPEMIIDGESGLIINPDVESIKVALLSLDKYDLDMMGIQSRKLFEERFTVSTMINSYISKFNSL